jgi:hypothetical protein
VRGARFVSCSYTVGCCQQFVVIRFMIYDMLYLLTAIGLSPGGSSTVHIYTQTIHRTTKKKTIHRTTQKYLEQCGPCPVLESYLPYN